MSLRDDARLYGRAPRLLRSPARTESAFRRRFKIGAPAFIVVALTLGVAVVLGFAAGDAAPALAAENGPVETVTVWLYGVVFLAALLAWRKGQPLGGLVAAASLLMALRELDAHAAFTRFGVFSTRLYARPDVPLMEKLAAGVAVLALVVLAIVALRGAWRDVNGRAATSGVTLLILLGFGVLLKQIDALPRQLRDLGWPLPENILVISKAVEEIGEMGLPIMLALALLQMPRRR